jgi:hypothetical protein
LEIALSAITVTAGFLAGRTARQHHQRHQRQQQCGEGFFAYFKYFQVQFSLIKTFENSLFECMCKILSQVFDFIFDLDHKCECIA